MVINEVNMVGQKFGRLLVVSRAPSKHKRAYWNCVCDCGKTCVANGKYMRQHKKQSCGCLRSEINKQKIQKVIAGNINPPGETAFNLLYATYRSSAEKRGLVFLLSKEDFGKITKQDCFYCGLVPNQLARPYLSGGYLFNGIDRRDNNEGYILDNVVPCCKMCNWMKNQFSENDFLNHCKRITEFQKVKD